MQESVRAAFTQTNADRLQGGDTREKALELISKFITLANTYGERLRKLLTHDASLPPAHPLGAQTRANPSCDVQSLITVVIHYRSPSSTQGVTEHNTQGVSEHEVATAYLRTILSIRSQYPQMRILLASPPGSTSGPGLRLPVTALSHVEYSAAKGLAEALASVDSALVLVLDAGVELFSGHDHGHPGQSADKGSYSALEQLAQRYCAFNSTATPPSGDGRGQLDEQATHLRHDGVDQSDDGTLLPHFVGLTVVQRGSLQVLAATCDVMSISDWTLYFNASRGRCDVVGSSFLALTSAVRQSASTQIGDHPTVISGERGHHH